jgi:hypothetical protein
LVGVNRFLVRVSGIEAAVPVNERGYLFASHRRNVRTCPRGAAEERYDELCGCVGRAIHCLEHTKLPIRLFKSLWQSRRRSFHPVNPAFCRPSIHVARSSGRRRGWQTGK